MASFSSSIITISCYTYVTDYFGFRNAYPDHVLELTIINLVTNFITLLGYSLVGQLAVYAIQRYINGDPIFFRNRQIRTLVFQGEHSK